jgi:hypothetical protein
VEGWPQRVKSPIWNQGEIDRKFNTELFIANNRSRYYKKGPKMYSKTVPVPPTVLPGLFIPVCAIHKKNTDIGKNFRWR